MKYDFEFSWESTYGYAARLVGDHAEPGLVVDLGCGAAPFAEPMSELGFGYHGFEYDAESIELCRSRGRQCDPIDLRDIDDTVRRVREAVGDRRVSVVSALDVIEHLPDPAAVLAGIASLVDELASDGVPPLLVVSIPNVAHRDIGAKLALGRWDVTDVGLLDSTHITLFTHARLAEQMSAAGFVELGRNDVVIADSEQQFPTDHPAIARSTPLHRHLSELRASVDEFAYTYQFVRCYRRSDPPATIDAASTSEPTFASVVVPTLGGPQLARTLSLLIAQDDQDFTVRVAPPVARRAVVDELVESLDPEFRRRVTVVASAEDDRFELLNTGLEAIDGRVAVFLEEGDIVSNDWIREFRSGFEESSGRIVRVWPSSFDLLSHLARNDTPLCALGIPSEAIRSLGLRFHDTGAGFESWSFLASAAPLVGVVDRVDAGTVLHCADQSVGSVVPEQVMSSDDDRHLLLPPGSSSALRRTMVERIALASQLDIAQQRIDAIERSRYWRLTAPLRWLTGLRGPRI